MTDQRYKEIMTAFGLPNSVSLMLALKQVANEVAREIPPPPPLTRLINEGSWYGFCPECGSSLARKFFIFGKTRCIHPHCNFEK